MQIQHLKTNICFWNEIGFYPPSEKLWYFIENLMGNRDSNNFVVWGLFPENSPQFKKHNFVAQDKKLNDIDLQAFCELLLFWN